MVRVSLLDSGPTALNRLGHIHKRQQISDKTGYEGSTYKSEFGEQNKFASLIHISNNNEATGDSALRSEHVPDRSGDVEGRDRQHDPHE